MDKRLEQRLLEFNSRYQDLAYRLSKIDKIKSYVKKLRNGNIVGLYNDLTYRNYDKKYFGQAGNDIESKDKKQDITGKRIAVYSCIIGRYDEVAEPVYAEPEIDYLMFTDMEIEEGSTWHKIDVTKFPQYKELSSIQMNRIIKFHPERFLPEYDYSIYIDGNIEPVAGFANMIANMGGYGFGVHYHSSRDCIYDEKVAVVHYKKANVDLVKAQLESYEREGFPHHFGLFENSVLIRDHHDQDVIELMNHWWSEYEKYPTRDQLSLPYLIWKHKFPKEKIYILGNNVDRNPRFNRTKKHV